MDVMVKGRRVGQRGSRGTAAARVDHHEVARLAYALYEQRGRVEGHALDDWLKAEAMVRERWGTT